MTNACSCENDLGEFTIGWDFDEEFNQLHLLDLLGDSTTKGLVLLNDTWSIRKLTSRKLWLKSTSAGSEYELTFVR